MNATSFQNKKVWLNVFFYKPYKGKFLSERTLLSEKFAEVTCFELPISIHLYIMVPKMWKLFSPEHNVFL